MDKTMSQPTLEGSFGKVVLRYFQWNRNSCRGLLGVSPNPNGIEAFSPAVASNELPWVRIERDHNPERVEYQMLMGMLQPFSGL